MQLCHFWVVSRSRRTVSRAPGYHILWVRGFRDHTISGRGFNLFKALRRHFRATPFAAAIPSTETPRFKRTTIGSAVSKAKGVGTYVERLRDFGKKFVERLGSYATFTKSEVVSTSLRRNLFFEGILWLLLCYSNILRAFPKPAPSFSNPCPQTGLEPARPGSEGV